MAKTKTRAKNSSSGVTRCSPTPSTWVPLGGDLDDHVVALAAARADRGAAEPAAAALELERERPEDPGAGGADRMAERDGAAVHVDLVLVDAEHPDRVEHHGGERLVDLPEVDVVGREPGLLERDLRGGGGRAREVGEVVGDLTLGHDRRERRAAVLLGPLVGGEDHRTRPVVHPRRIAGGVGAVLLE